jgi:hypothetical protein
MPGDGRAEIDGDAGAAVFPFQCRCVREAVGSDGIRLRHSETEVERAVDGNVMEWFPPEKTREPLRFFRHHGSEGDPFKADFAESSSKRFRREIGGRDQRPPCQQSVHVSENEFGAGVGVIN